jgi:signal transduction histidine kinase
MVSAAVRTESSMRAAALPLLGRAPASAAVAVAAVVAAAVATVVITGGDAWGRELASQVVVDVAVGLTCPPIGAVVLLAPGLGRGTRQLAWVLLGAGTAAALTALATSFVLVAAQPSAAVVWMAQLQSWLWVPGFLPLLTLVPLSYPDGLLPGRLWRLTALAACVGSVLLAAGVALYPEVVSARVAIDKPLTWPAGAPVLTLLAATLLVPAMVLSAASLVVRLRLGTGLRRRQVMVLLAAAAALLAVTAVQGLLPSPADTLAQAVAVALLPVAIGVAVTRHGLYELDVAIRRALVALSLAVCLGGTYLTVFSLARTLGPDGSAVGATVAAGVTGVIVAPLHRRLSAGADRLLYGDRADPYAVSARLAARLAERATDVAEVPQAVCDVIVQTLRLGSAQIALASGEERSVVAAASAGSRAPGSAEGRFPLRHRGEEVGWLTVTARPGEPALDRRDEDILTTVAGQAAPALAALRLHQQLQHSREALVLAREEERLRLRRELHDGVGATLAGLRLQVESAQALSADPATASLLQAASHGVAGAVAEVRSITESLRPPAIDELGLASALALLAERLSTPGLTVNAAVDGDLDALPPAVEVAAYRIASEALANAVQHSGGTVARLIVRVDPTAHHLLLEVHDNGQGPVPAPRSDGSGRGLGVPAMRQRAEELGGALEVGPSQVADDGRAVGTVVRALLPTGRNAPERPV